MTDFANFLLNGITLGAIYALIAVGYTMVYGIIKLINFAHGEFYMFGAFVGYFVLTGIFAVPPQGGEPGYLALLAALLAAGVATGLLAVLVERLCYRPLRNAGRIVALLSALGVSLFFQNMGQQAVGADFRKFPPTIAETRYPRSEVPLESLKEGQVAERDLRLTYYVKAEDGRDQQRVITIANGGEAIDGAQLATARDLAASSTLPAAVHAYPRVTVSNRHLLIFLALLLVSAALYVLVMRTRFGRAMRAVSVDFEAARLMGINVDLIVSGTFFIGAFVAGICGVLAGGMTFERIDPLMGLMPGLKAFVAAVLGGIGSIPGALLGALLLGVSEKMVEAYVSSGLRDALSFGILILVLLVKPSGLLGRFEGEKV
ncbi:MAG: branched-chain amino acid ABC transporter permease [Planctomycetota bacterium]|nr:branched-chain amino acid ABC transporter permease [Planctomycetota bacterium]